MIQVDVTFGPRPDPITWTFYAPVQILLHLLHLAVGGQWSGRVYAMAALFICGAGAMVLLRDLPWWAQCIAGLLAMLNPFVYDRLVEGQWGVIVATAGLFLVLASWLQMRRKPTPFAGTRVAGSALLTIMFSQDFAGILLVLVIALAIFESSWRLPRFRQAALTACGVFLLLSLYGTLGFFLTELPSSYAGVSRFNHVDFEAFRSTASPNLGTVPALVGLYGEWSERLGRYLAADRQYWWWFIPATVLLLLAILGACYRPKRSWLLLIGALGIAVSASTTTSAGIALMTALDRHLPLVGAYREPQKWAALWLLALVVLVAEGLRQTPDVLRRVGSLRRRPLTVAGATMLVAALTAAAVIAPAGWVALRNSADVVKPVSYPASWYQTAAYLAGHVPSDETVAILPWHLYEVLPFVRHPSADPALNFFPGRLLASSDPELPGRMPTDRIGEATRRGSACALASALRKQGIQWALAVLDAPDGYSSGAALEQCGFKQIFNSANQVAVYAAHA